MGHGGARPGSGRKPGSKLAVRTRAAAERLSAQGVTPLEVMLEAMQAHHAAGRIDEAAEIASKAAPYVHPRLAAVQHVGRGGFEGMSLQDLRDEVRRCLKERFGIGFDEDGRPVIEGRA